MSPQTTGSFAYAALGTGCTLLSCLGKLSLASLRVAKSCTSFGWGKGENVTSTGWQVTLCHPTWHVSSRSSEAGLLTKGVYLLY